MASSLSIQNRQEANNEAKNLAPKWPQLVLVSRFIASVEKHYQTYSQNKNGLAHIVWFSNQNHSKSKLSPASVQLANEQETYKRKSTSILCTGPGRSKPYISFNTEISQQRSYSWSCECNLGFIKRQIILIWRRLKSIDTFSKAK